MMHTHHTFPEKYSQHFFSPLCSGQLSLFYLLKQTSWPQSHFHLWATCYSISSSSHYRLFCLFPFSSSQLDSSFVQRLNSGSLEVAYCNGVLALCFVPRSPVHHLLLPVAPGCMVTCSLHSFSSDRSNTLNRSSFARDSMMIEEILAPTKDTVRQKFSSFLPSVISFVRIFRWQFLKNEMCVVLRIAGKRLTGFATFMLSVFPIKIESQGRLGSLKQDAFSCTGRSSVETMQALAIAVKLSLILNKECI